jgi:hypothetical protein
MRKIFILGGLLAGALLLNGAGAKKGQDEQKEKQTGVNEVARSATRLRFGGAFCF